MILLKTLQWFFISLWVKLKIPITATKLQIIWIPDGFSDLLPRLSHRLLLSSSSDLAEAQTPEAHPGLRASRLLFPSHLCGLLPPLALPVWHVIREACPDDPGEPHLPPPPPSRFIFLPAPSSLVALTVIWPRYFFIFAFPPKRWFSWEKGLCLHCFILYPLC